MSSGFCTHRFGACFKKKLQVFALRFGAWIKRNFGSILEGLEPVLKGTLALCPEVWSMFQRGTLGFCFEVQSLYQKELWVYTWRLERTLGLYFQVGAWIRKELQVFTLRFGTCTRRSSGSVLCGLELVLDRNSESKLGDDYLKDTQKLCLDVWSM